MKKIIGIIFISLIFASIGLAEIKRIDTKRLFGTVVMKICVDGYKFVQVTDDRGEAVISLVQAFEERDGKSLPAKC